MIINQLRTYHEDFTESELFINGNDRFCYVLEDVGRPYGVKVPRETCIPEGHYIVTISISTRWNKPMLLLYNTRERTVERFGVTFTGIRMHGGNDVDDTEGCPLTAYKSDHKGKVWDRASDDLLELVRDAMDNGEKVELFINEKARL